MTVTAPTLHPGSRAMIIVHRAFRRETRVLGELIAAVAPGDARRARVLADFLDRYRAGLHVHHTGEDELFWPPLLARVDLDADIVLRMEEQHRHVAATLDEVAARTAAWRDGASAAARDALVAALARHRAALVEHLDDEERHLLPLAERHLTPEEWASTGEHFIEHTPKLQALLFLGLVLEDADDGERALMLGAMPAPARFLWKTVGRRRYANFVRRIRHDDAPSRLGTALAIALGGFITYIGVAYLVAPAANAASFGLPAWPHGDAAAFLTVKGVRDLASGLITFTLLARREHRALGWTFLAMAAVPFGDMLTVLGNHGSTGAALGVHGLTALAVAATGALLVRSTRRR